MCTLLRVPTIAFRQLRLGRICTRQFRPLSTSPSPVVGTLKRHEEKFDLPPPPEPPVATMIAEKLAVATPEPTIVGAMIPWKLMPLMGKFIFPVSWPIMYYLHGLHEVFPWWASIALCTLTIRSLMIPLVIKSTATTTRWMNVMPKERHLNEKYMDALCAGNMMDAQNYQMKIKLLHKQHQVSQYQRLWPLMAQTPVFMSMFSILRTLAHKQDSMKEGGMLWFQDLSVMDPYYVLPAMTCITLLVSLELGAETGGSNQMPKQVRYLMRIAPIGLFYIVYDFPAAMLCYWVVSNAFSLVQSVALKNATIRKKLNIPQAVKHNKSDLGMDKSLSELFRDFKSKSKASYGPEEIRRLDRISFEKAAIGPIQKTYNSDPTKKTYL